MASLHRKVIVLLLATIFLESAGAQPVSGTSGLVPRHREEQAVSHRRHLQEGEQTVGRSCLSRTEQHAFRKIPHVLPAALEQAIRDYEMFHKDCRAREDNLGNKFLNNGTLPCKYLLWVAPYDGMGNRIMSFISSYLLAMLTNRVLVTDRRWRWEEIFCEPMLQSSLLLDVQVRTDIIFHHSIKLKELSDQIASGQMRREADPPYSMTVHITHEPDMRALCPTEFTYLDTVPLLVMSSNMYFIPGLYFTHLGSRIDELFPDRVIFGRLARYLLNPVDELWSNIKAYHSETLASATGKLGVQVRAFEHPWRPEKSQRLLHCAQQHNLLPSDAAAAPDNWSEDGNADEKVVCLVASLHSQFLDNLLAAYAAKPVVGGKRVSILKAGRAIVLEQASEQLQHNLEVIMEIWMLSFCDDVIASPGSTFGYIATGLLGKAPIFLEGLFHDEGEFNGEICWIGISSDPCFHHPPMHQECPSDARVEWPWEVLAPVAKQCRDWPRGIRLRPR